MVQDYQHINQWMIKNGYPLSLIVGGHTGWSRKEKGVYKAGPEVVIQ